MKTVFELSEEDLIGVINGYMTDYHGDVTHYKALKVIFLENSNDEVHIHARVEIEDE